MGKKIYDKNGKWVATQSKNLFGGDVIRDRDGKIQNYLGTDFLGNRVVRDRDGKVQAYVGKDVMGRGVLRDRDGERQAWLDSDGRGGVNFINNQGHKYGYAAPGKDGTPGFFGGSSRPAPGGGRDRNPPAPYRVPSPRDMDAMYAGGTGLPYTGGRILRSPEEERLEKHRGRLFLLSLAAYILPLVYVTAAFVVGSLPLSYPGMLTLMTAGILLAYTFSGASDSSGSAMGHVFLFLLPSLVCMLQVVLRFGGRVQGLSSREALQTILIGPGCFLAAMIVGGILGRAAGRRLQDRVLHGKRGQSEKKKSK